MPGGWYGSLLRKRSVEEEWSAMKDHIDLLKFVKSDVFVFADVSDSIQSLGDIPLKVVAIYVVVFFGIDMV